MADERQSPDNEDDELLLTEEVEPGEDDEHREDDDDKSNVNDEGEEEEVLTFGDGADEQDDDTNLVKHLRTQIRERDKRLAEVERPAPKDEPTTLRPEPDYERDAEKYGYDEDMWREDWKAWHTEKAEYDRAQQQRSQATDAEREAWAKELHRVDQQKAELPFDDADDAFDTVRASLNTVQQAVIVKASDNAARVIYALAKHPDRLAELAAIEDPLKLAAKVAKMEAQLKVIKRRRAPDPDRPERGSGRVSTQGKDKKLAKLEAEAEKTGDRTELIRYRKSLTAKK